MVYYDAKYSYYDVILAKVQRKSNPSPKMQKKLLCCRQVNMWRDPKKIARKGFMVYFYCIRSGKQNTKSWHELNHQKGSKFDTNKDGRQ